MDFWGLKMHRNVAQKWGQIYRETCVGKQIITKKLKKKAEKSGKKQTKTGKKKLKFNGKITEKIGLDGRT